MSIAIGTNAAIAKRSEREVVVARLSSLSRAARTSVGYIADPQAGLIALIGVRTRTSA